MKISRGMSLYLLLLLVLLLEFVSPSAGLNYTIVPQNVTVRTGKSATFRCGALSNGLSDRLSFTVQRPDTNYTLTCPGKDSDVAALSLNGRCENRLPEIIATWDIANVAANINGTIFKCSAIGLSDKYAYLWIEGSSTYYAMLFGCVMGGFFGILIVFAVTYVSLKRSERLQNCFKGPDDDDDEARTADTSKNY